MAALSQRELAQKIGTHQSTICDLENLNRAGYPATIRRLSEALEVEPAVLLYGKHYQDLN
jgi:transcriptional regulator with XRE-family HTH domain